MKQKSSFLSSGIYAILLLFLMFICHGCTAICYSIGAAQDNSRPPQKYGFNKISELQSGDRIRIIRRDSSVVEGRYKGVAPLDSFEYASTEGFLPPNESIVVGRKGKDLTIPLNDVTYIGKFHPGYAKWIGFGIGLATDAGIVAGIAIHNSLSHSGSYGDIGWDWGF